VKESSKTRQIWGPLERSVLSGSGIDIGCGPDPVTPDCATFDVEDGDANEITRFVSRQFDFVYSSHCLEHMHDPRAALLQWWALVKPGGHLFFIVPDEDLYEQGFFPSRFNGDHKSTFTISKASSWSPVSVNVLDLVAALPGSQLLSVKLQDLNYDRRLLKHGASPRGWRRWLGDAYSAWKARTSIHLSPIDRWYENTFAIDQTRRPDVLAQIQCIVKKAREDVRVD
jgi:SAM-dependent methyltransferase